MKKKPPKRAVKPLRVKAYQSSLGNCFLDKGQWVPPEFKPVWLTITPRRTKK